MVKYFKQFELFWWSSSPTADLLHVLMTRVQTLPLFLLNFHRLKNKFINFLAH